MEKKRIYIVGGGPSGIMCAYRLKQLDKKLDITIFESNSNTYNDYKDKGYCDLKNWLNAMNDNDYKETYTTEDKKLDLMMGKGLGGGTLHFGLQYIDQIDILKKTSTEFKSDEFQDILMDISGIIKAKRYD